MSLTSAQAVTITSGPSFLSAVWVSRLKYIKVVCMWDVDQGKRNDFGQGVRGSAELRSWSSTGQGGESGGSPSRNCSKAVRNQGPGATWAGCETPHGDGLTSGAFLAVYFVFDFSPRLSCFIIRCGLTMNLFSNIDQNS